MHGQLAKYSFTKQFDRWHLDLTYLGNLNLKTRYPSITKLQILSSARKNISGRSTEWVGCTALSCSGRIANGTLGHGPTFL